MDNHREQLLQIFSGKSEEQIDQVIQIVQQANLSADEAFEEMVNLLIESGDSTLVNGAVGVSSSINAQLERDEVKFTGLFPEIDIEYLKTFCERYEGYNFTQIVEDLADTDYVKTRKDPIDVWEHLKEMLPEADPIYLRNHARVLATRPENELQEFIHNSIEKHDYPTMQSYLKNKELTTCFEKFITKFSVETYLEEVSNPLELYLSSNRKSILLTNDSQEDLQFALIFLYNQFLYQRKKEIDKVFYHYNKDLVPTCMKLKTLPKAFRRPRESIEYPSDCKNVELFKQVAFLKYEKQIRQHLKQKDDKYKSAFEEAKRHGLLDTCACCFDDQLIPEECYFCEKGCVFCKECVKLGAEQVIGKEETLFPCLADCNSHFHYGTLQMVLETKVFQKLWYRKQIEDIKKANVDGLETCPFCDYCMIPSDANKIFKCQNLDCMIESCRLCRHKSHIPLRCDEIEYDEDVKMRTYIENKMTEALLRKCWKCSRQFYKETGCNKMTCLCGAKMCYICGAAVVDYNHFQNERCPLMTNDLRQFHLNAVLKGAASAKQELGVNVDTNKLKFDPTRNIEQDIA